MQLMTQAEYARHRGVGKPAVSNWKRDGLLVLAEDPANGRIKVDVERTDAKLNAKRDPMRGRPPTGAARVNEAGELAPAADPSPRSPDGESPSPRGGEGNSLADERLEELRERRIGNALKNAQAARELVPLIEAERRVSEIGRVARERMHAWYRSIAERLAAEKDIRAVISLGEEGIDQVFNELADAAEQGQLVGDEEDLTVEERAELAALAAEN